MVYFVVLCLLVVLLVVLTWVLWFLGVSFVFDFVLYGCFFFGFGVFVAFWI